MSDVAAIIAAIDKEGDGIFSLELIHLHPESTADIRAKAEAGDERARRIVITAARLIDSIEKPKRGQKRPNCMLCGLPFYRHRRPPRGFAFFHARVERPHRSLSAGICEACLDQHGHDYDRVKAAVMDAIERDFRKPRSIRVLRTSGRA